MYALFDDIGQMQIAVRTNYDDGLFGIRQLVKFTEIYVVLFEAGLAHCYSVGFGLALKRISQEYIMGDRVTV
ncbi:hypothetical protein F4776DRAFT_611410 [Hypoxylon sp. NC0597]|nr:hypothetical protein F4776DRAFT_611410 [Hypoxylon sp. NC0597]